MKPSAIIINYCEANSKLKQVLLNNNFDVEISKNSAIAFKKMKNSFFDICYFISSNSYLSSCKSINHLKQIAPQTIVFFIGSKIPKKEIIAIYQSGAFDVFDETLDYRVLIIKANNKIQKNYFQEKKKEEYIFGKYSLNYKFRQLTYNNETVIKLTPKECDVLWLLIDNTDQFVTKSKVLQLIWKKEDYFTGKCLDVYINKLRKHLLLDKSLKIENIRQSGFRLVIC